MQAIIGHGIYFVDERQVHACGPVRKWKKFAFLTALFRGELLFEAGIYMLPLPFSVPSLSHHKPLSDTAVPLPYSGQFLGVEGIYASQNTLSLSGPYRFVKYLI